MQLLKEMRRARGGFTLVEMTVVIAIIAVLAALTLPAVTGITTETRTTSKTGDLKEVDQSAVRFESENPGTFPTASVVPATTVSDSDGSNDGIIKIAVMTTSGTNDPVADLSDEDVVCDGGGTLQAAIDVCFGPIDFATDLVPTFLKVAPQHSSGTAADVTAGTGSNPNGVSDGVSTVADLIIPNCNLAGDTCEFYLDDHTTADDLTGVLDVWNVDSNLLIFAFKEDAQYGK